MWAFIEPPKRGVRTNPTEGELFINDRVDRPDSLIREAGQNSSDARRQDVPTAELRFTLIRGQDVPTAEQIHPYIADLIPHLEACGIDLGAIDFKKPSILLVEDFGTVGLQGATDEDDEESLALFWRNVGDSHKGGVRGGRWGLGKTVFANSSRIAAWFGLTIRADDLRELLIGQVALRKHKLDETTYLPHALFCSKYPAPDEAEGPIEDPERLAAFRSTFCLSRKQEPGLSVVIPFPHESITEQSLLKAAIQHFFFPILRRRMIININGRELSADSIRGIAAELDLRDMESAIAVAGEICSTPPESISTVDYPEALAFPNGPLGSSSLTPEKLLLLKQSYRQGQLTAISVPILIRPKNEDPKPSHIKLFLKHIPEISRGTDFYLRDGISVIDHRTFGEAEKAVGVLLADDEVASRFLGDAENPSHTAWNAKGKGLEVRYCDPQKTVMFIRRSLRQFYDLVAKEEDVEDRQALSDVFFVPKEGRGENRPPPTPPPPPSPPPPAKPSKTQLTKVEGGFGVKAGSGLTASDLPIKVNIQVAYDVRKGNPFNKYDKRDFSLESKDISVYADSPQVSDAAASGNTLSFQANTMDFSVRVTGFDPHRDLKIKDRVLAEEEGISVEGQK